MESSMVNVKKGGWIQIWVKSEPHHILGEEFINSTASVKSFS